MSLIVFMPVYRVMSCTETSILKQLQEHHGLKGIIYISLDALHQLMKKEFGDVAFTRLIERIPCSLNYPLLMLAWSYAPKTRAQITCSVVIDYTYGLSPIVAAPSMTCSIENRHSYHKHGYVIVQYFLPITVAIIANRTSRQYYRNVLNEWIL